VKQSYIDVRILEGFVKQGVPSAAFVGSLLGRALLMRRCPSWASLPPICASTL
jgi:hypothetical protein